MNFWKIVLFIGVIALTGLVMPSSSYENSTLPVETLKMEARHSLQLIGSSNFTDPKVQNKRQSGFGRVTKKKPVRDSKIYLDEYDRDHYLNSDGTGGVSVGGEKDQDGTGGSSSSQIFRSNYHSTGYSDRGGTYGPGYYSGGFPATGFGPGASPVGGSAGFGHGHGNSFGWGGLVGGAGHAVGHSFHVFDPIFLMITLSFILFLVNSILGIVDRFKLPIVLARSADVPIQSDLGLEIVDGLINEIRSSLDRYVENDRKVRKTN